MFPETRDTTSRIGVGLALLLGLLGSLITFVPGGEAGWFGMAAVPAALGLLSPSWRVRVVAIVLVLVWQARLGYQRGQAYQEWLRQQD